VLDVLFPDRFRHVQHEVLQAARERGNRRHLLFGVLLLWHEGVAAEPVIDPRDQAAANGIMNWILSHDVRPLKVEEPAVNVKDGYAGQPDALVLYGSRRWIVLPDFKSGLADIAHPIQVQAYSRLHGYEDAQMLMDIYVDDDGFVEEKRVGWNAHDYAWFLAGLQVLKGRLARGKVNIYDYQPIAKED
jgi:hypothetical protein